MKFRADFLLCCPHSALRICCWETKAHLEQNFRLHAQKFQPSDSLICDLIQPMLSTVTLETLGLEILLQESCKTSPQHVASSGTRRRKKNTVGHPLKSTSLTWTPISNFSPLSGSSITIDKFLQIVIASAWRQVASKEIIYEHTKLFPRTRIFIGSNLLKQTLKSLG